MMDVWVLEVWAPQLVDRGAEAWPGFDGQGSRLLEYYGDVFSSVEVAKQYVAEGIGWDDVRWLRVADWRWVGVTRGLHKWTSVERPERVRMKLTREHVIDATWVPA